MYTEVQVLAEGDLSAILDLFGSSSCHVLWRCHPFKGCALPASLLFQYGEAAHLEQILEQYQWGEQTPITSPVLE